MLLMLVVGAGTMLATAGAGQASPLCSSQASGAPWKFGATSKECSFTSPNSPKWTGKLVVQWKTQDSTQQAACVEGRMASAGKQEQWQGLGCGKSGQGTVAWPANTASMLEIRVKSMNVGVAIVDYYI